MTTRYGSLVYVSARACDKTDVPRGIYIWAFDNQVPTPVCVG